MKVSVSGGAVAPKISSLSFGESSSQSGICAFSQNTGVVFGGGFVRPPFISVNLDGIYNLIHFYLSHNVITRLILCQIKINLVIHSIRTVR